MAAHFIKNYTKQNLRLTGTDLQPSDDVLYVSLKAKDLEHDYKVVKHEKEFEITDLATNKTSTINATNFDFEYDSLLRFDFNGERRLIQ